MKEIRLINEEEFNKIVYEEKNTVLVDFFASWCGPCKMMAPILEEVNKSLDDEIICKVDVDENFELSKKFGVLSIPTLILFKNGEEIQKSIGLKNKDFILNMIKS